MPESAARDAMRLSAATLFLRPAAVGPDGYLRSALYVMPGEVNSVVVMAGYGVVLAANFDVAQKGEPEDNLFGALNLAPKMLHGQSAIH